MKITPVTGVGAIKDLSTPEHVRTAKAVEAFNRASKQSSQPTPVPNPSQVSVEELGAIQAPKTDESETVEASTATAEETQPEVKAEASKPEDTKPEQDPALSRQFAQLARQERALRAKVQAETQALKAREEAIKAREAAVAAKDQEYTSGYVPRSRIKADALGVLAEEGVSYDEITQQILNQHPVDPRLQATINGLQDEIKALKQANTDSKQSYEQRQQEQYKAAIKQIEADTKNLVSKDPEAYEAIAKTGSIKDVVDLIEQTYHKDGILLSVEEAAQEVEDYLIEEGINTVSRIDKIKKRLALSNASQVKTDVKTPATKAQTQPAPMKTLTNATASTRQLSARERALLAFKGELK